MDWTHTCESTAYQAKVATSTTRTRVRCRVLPLPRFSPASSNHQSSKLHFRVLRQPNAPPKLKSHRQLLPSNHSCFQTSQACITNGNSITPHTNNITQLLGFPKRTSINTFVFRGSRRMVPLAASSTSAFP